MKWLILIAAGIFEIGWAVGLKYTHGFTRLWPTVGTVAAMIVSLGLLGIALKSFPIGMAYAVWVGVGVVGTAMLGIVLFGESASAVKLASIALIVAGIIGLSCPVKHELEKNENGVVDVIARLQVRAAA